MSERSPSNERKSRGFSAHEGWESNMLVGMFAFPLLIFAFLFEDVF